MYFTFHTICFAAPGHICLHDIHWQAFVPRDELNGIQIQIRCVSWSVMVSNDLPFILDLACLPSVAVPYYTIVGFFSYSCVLCMYRCCILWGEKTNVWIYVGYMICIIALATSVLYGQLFLSCTVFWSCSLIPNIPTPVNIAVIT